MRLCRLCCRLTTKGKYNRNVSLSKIFSLSVYQVDKNLYTPLIIAAGGGGRGYSSRSGSQLEQMDYDQLGRNGKSHGAGIEHTRTHK